MIGTNDIGGLKGVPKEYEAGLRKIIDKCIVAHCIPILNTIPPRRNHMEAVAAVNEVVKKLAVEYKIPLVDYCGEIIRRHPEDWDGTLIDKDGVHPSNPSKQSADLSEANINSNGYPLRTWMNFMMFREVYLKIMSAPKPFSELIGNVEEIGNGIICPVTADTEVSYYLDASDNERIWNWGKSEKIKFKGYEEFLLLDFDTSKVPRKSKIKKATLYLGRTENCVIPVVGVTTIMSETVFWCLDEPVYRDDFLCLEMLNGMTRTAYSQLSPEIKVDFRVDLSRIEESKDMLDKTDLLVMAQANIREFPTIVRDHFRNYVRSSEGKAQKLWVYGGTSKISDSNTSNRGFSIASYFLDAH